MIQFKKILVPTDFSEPSKKAMTYGLTLSVQFNARVIVAHIVPESSALTYAFPTETFDIEREQEQKARREIASLVPPEYADRFDVQTIVKIGNIEKALLDIVNDERVDLVVMGTHGRNYLGLNIYMSLFPGLAIMITVLGFNILGDGLRDMLDPRR